MLAALYTCILTWIWIWLCDTRICMYMYIYIHILHINGLVFRRLICGWIYLSVYINLGDEDSWLFLLRVNEWRCGKVILQMRDFQSARHVCALLELVIGLHEMTRWWQLKYFLFSSLFGEDSHFDYCNIFQRGWNHQLDDICCIVL